MDLILCDNENDTADSSNYMNKIVDDVYNENMFFLLKNKSEGKVTEDTEEIKDVDPLSFKMEALIGSLEEETKLLNEEKNTMRTTFQDIALQLKNVKRSIKEAERYLEEFSNEEKGSIADTYFEDMEKVINNM